MSMTVRTVKGKGDTSIVNFGPVLRSDPDAHFAVYHLVGFTDQGVKPEDRKTALVQRGKLPRNGRLKLKGLPYGEPYLVIATGKDKAGGVGTDRFVLRHPFLVTLDANKRVAVPQLKPRLSSLAIGVKRAV
jgi:hypothetical protein